LGIVVFVNWEPFNFTTDPALLARRIQKVSLIPFADYHAGAIDNAFDQIVRKALLFMPIGALLVPGASTGGWSWGGLRAVLAGAILAGVLEAGQLALPSRYASVTDVLIESVGAWLGFALTCKVRFALQAPGCLV
jgi:glycopeptide antibiotics resistance protein